MNKSPDAYRTISEVAEELDLPQHVLRFWETRFGQIKPLKRAGGRRFYRPDDVDLLKGIRHLLYKEGYTIKGVQRILKDQGVKAVIAAMRDITPDGQEGEAPVEPTPPQPPMAERYPMPPQVSVPFIDAAKIEDKGARRMEPPPLAVPSFTPTNVAFEAGSDDVLAHSEHEPPPPAPRKREEREAAFTGDLFADLPSPLPLSPEPPPASQLLASSSQVSMFRGGITLADKGEPALKGVVAPPPPIPEVSPAPVDTPQGSPQKHSDRKEENRAILTFALQELATCRALIEDLRQVQQAAE